MRRKGHISSRVITLNVIIKEESVEGRIPRGSFVILRAHIESFCIRIIGYRYHPRA